MTPGEKCGEPRCALGAELHGARHRVHADSGVAFENDLAVYAHHHAIVRAGEEIHSFSARREPRSIPADPVVPHRPVLLVEKREVDSRDAFRNDQKGASVPAVRFAKDRDSRNTP